MAILLKNATYIEWQTLEFRKTNILVKPGKVDFFDPASIPTGVDEVIDCTGKLVTKSFVVGHHHAYSALSRGMNPPRKTPTNFYEILKYVWWTLDKCLSTEMVEYSGLVTAMACAKAGATFAIDHHASPNAVSNSLSTLASAFEKVGVNHLLCYEISDRDGELIAQQGLEETDRYLDKHQGLVGLHASFTLGDKTLTSAAELMRRHQSGIHIHVAEGLYDQEHCCQNHDQSVIERLNSFGLLSSSKSILVHCLHLSGNERDIIASSPCWVVQNTDSNLNNNVGYFNSKGLGNNLMLGTDGMHSDMLQSMKSAYFVGQNFDPMSPMQAYSRLRNAHRYLSSNNFSGDDESNLLVIDYNSPTPVTPDNFAAHLVFGINSSHIRDVISNGKLIVKNHRLTLVDEEALLIESRKIAAYLWKRTGDVGAE